MIDSTDRRVNALDGLEEIAKELRGVGQSLAKTAGRLASASDAQTASIALRQLQELADRVTTSKERLTVVTGSVQRLADATFAELDADLRDALRAGRWRCDGQWPKFFVERAIEVVVDEKDRSAAVGGRKTASPSVESIIGALAPLVATLLPKGFDPEEFIEHLAAAFDVARAGGSTAAIFDVYRAYVMGQQKPKFWRNANNDNFSGVSTEQFRARLTKTLDANLLITRNRRSLRLVSPLDPKDGLFVYQPAEKRFAFVGRVEFVQEA
jgi:hypothetical protein